MAQQPTRNMTPLTSLADIPATREELLAWLDAMPPITRARLLRLLVDSSLGVELAARRRAAIAEAAAAAPAAEVAAELGVSVHAIYKAVKEHNGATGRRRPRTVTHDT